MKKLNTASIVLITLFLLSSCGSTTKLIGEVNMLSTRNINTTFDYQQLTTYSGGSSRQLKKAKNKNIQEAVTQTVKAVPGGEFLMNVKIYMVNDQYFAVEGDVWGRPIEDSGYQGYKIGDEVMWKVLGGYKKGKITAIKDSERCVVEDEQEHKYIVKYDNLMRSFSE